MEKILFVTDATKPDNKMLDFACFLCNLTGAGLTGIFLENLEYEERTMAAIRESAAFAGILASGSLAEVKEQCSAASIQRFRNTCAARGINCKVHRDRGVPLQEVALESRYADLLLINAATSFAGERQQVPTRFVKDVLARAECPVVVAPGNFEGIEELVFTYDGQASSVYAIKQFTYLFPMLRNQKVRVITVHDREITDPGQRYKLGEWLHLHYRHVEFETTEGNIKPELLEQLLKCRRAFIVMGAYGRSAASVLFSPSHALPVLKLVTQPVFITHR